MLMKSVGERIKELRDKNGLSQEELAALTSEISHRGISRQSISYWESGKSTPRSDNLSAVATALGVDVATLLDGTDTKIAPSPKEERVEIVEHYGMNGTIKVPVYEDFMSACAGRGTDAVEGVVKEELEIPIWLLGGTYSTRPGESPFIVRINGDSMEEADIPDGCQVLVNPIAEADNGDVVIAELDGDWMVKWVYWNRHCDGGELRSASLKYPVKKFTKEDVETGRFRYIGKVCKSMTTPQKGA